MKMQWMNLVVFTFIFMLTWFLLFINENDMSMRSVIPTQYKVMPGCWRGGAYKEPYNMTGNAIVFRVHSLTDAQAMKVCAYGKRAQSTGMDFWVSMDAQSSTVLDNDKHKLEKFCAGTVYNTHSYTTNDLLKKFPALREVRKCAVTIQWSFHVEPISLWHQHAKSKGRSYKQVWIFEQDVGVSGDIAMFLSHFHTIQSDLIAPKQRPSTPQWKNSLCHTRKYGDLTRTMQRVNVQEMVVRLSEPYLEYLANMSSNGIIGWSEESVVTLCVLGGYKHYVIPASFFGRYTFDTRVTSEEWDTILSECPNTIHRIGLLYHALKF